MGEGERFFHLTLDDSYEPILLRCMSPEMADCVAKVAKR